MQQMHEMRRQMHAQAAQMQAQMQGQAAQMQAQAAQMHAQVQANTARMHRQHAEMHRDMQQARRQWSHGGGGGGGGGRSHSYSFSSGAGGSVSTSIVNGYVYVNGERVARVPPGSGVSLSTVNGTVYLNNEVVWPRPGGGGALPTPPAIAPDGERSARRSSAAAAGTDAAEVLACRFSAVGVCAAHVAEPCAVCLEDIREGQMTRTLPCFHIFHRHCAEAHFSNEAGRGPAGVVLCPVCRHPVSDEVPSGAEVVDLLD